MKCPEVLSNLFHCSLPPNKRKLVASTNRQKLVLQACSWNKNHSAHGNEMWNKNNLHSSFLYFNNNSVRNIFSVFLDAHPEYFCFECWCKVKQCYENTRNSLSLVPPTHTYTHTHTYCCVRPHTTIWIQLINKKCYRSRWDKGRHENRHFKGVPHRIITLQKNASIYTERVWEKR